MKLGSLAPWFGAKRSIAPEIVQQAGPHRVYWEPFCGSCAVLFAKPQVTYETVNDLHADLFNLAKVLQEEAKAVDLYDRVSRTLFHENMLPMAKGILTREITCDVPEDPAGDVHRAYWYLVWSWMGMNGIAGTPLASTGTFAVRYTQGGQPAKRWCSVADSIPDWHQRLRGVQILNRNAFDILPRIEDVKGTVIYADPPYLVKSSQYVHDFTMADHDRLAKELTRFCHARVIVSYYQHHLLKELYPGWTVLRLSANKGMANSSRLKEKGRVEATEVLLINGPILDPTLFEDQP